MRGPEVSVPLSRAESGSIVGAVVHHPLTFEFVLNVGAEVASFDSQQSFLRSRLCEVGYSRHAAHDSRGCVIRDAEH